MTEVIIGNGVRSIGWQAFKDCTELTSVTLGKNLQYLYGGAFSGCKNLFKFICLGKVPSTSYGSIYNGYKYIAGCEDPFDEIHHAWADVYVPYGCVEAYKKDIIIERVSANFWRKFMSIIEQEVDFSSIKMNNIESECKDYIIYDLKGTKQHHLKSGVNILHKRDGTTKKVFVK